MIFRLIEFILLLFGAEKTETSIITVAPQDGSEVPEGEVIVVNPEDTENTEEPTAKRESRFLWCLDNGHGINTAGKRSPILEDGRQLLEYSFNRDIVRRIAEYLDEFGIDYFITMPDPNTGNALEERVARANNEPSEKPKLFLSVHANAAPAPFGSWCTPSISGIETWFYHTSARGRKMAAIFQKHLVNRTGFKNRYIKSRPANQFFVLRKTGMTAVLTENGIYNNKEECKRLLSDEVRNEIAYAHFLAIREIEEVGLV